jgi:hypothetical protein
MPIFELSLSAFSFPPQLDEARSTFRFITNIRYINKDGDFETVQAVSPGLDTYWECEKGNKNSPFFVRLDDLSPRFDMNKIDSWERMIIVLRAKGIHSLQIKVIDIEKKGGLLDTIRDYANSLIQSFIGMVKTKVTEAVPVPISFAKDTLGEAVSDVEALALSTLSGMKGKESLLFKQSKRGAELPQQNGDFSISGNGHQGNYNINLHLEITPDQ